MSFFAQLHDSPWGHGRRVQHPVFDLEEGSDIDAGTKGERAFTAVIGQHGIVHSASVNRQREEIGSVLHDRAGAADGIVIHTVEKLLDVVLHIGDRLCAVIPDNAVIAQHEGIRPGHRDGIRNDCARTKLSTDDKLAGVSADDLPDRVLLESQQLGSIRIQSEEAVSVPGRGSEAARAVFQDLLIRQPVKRVESGGVEQPVLHVLYACTPDSFVVPGNDGECMRCIHLHNLQIVSVQTEHAILLTGEEQHVHGAVRHIYAIDGVDFVGDTGLVIRAKFQFAFILYLTVAEFCVQMPYFPVIVAAEDTGVQPAARKGDQKVLLLWLDIIPPGQACQRTDGLAFHLRPHLNAYTVRFELPVCGIHVFHLHGEAEILVIPITCLVQTGKGLHLDACFIR